MHSNGSRSLHSLRIMAQNYIKQLRLNEIQAAIPAHDPGKKKGYKIPSVEFMQPSAKHQEQQQQNKRAYDVNQAYEVAKQFIEMLEKGGFKQMKEEPEQTEIKEIAFEVGQGWFGLPILGGIDHPILIGTQYAQKVPVGSRSWLIVLDQLRTYGYPKSEIAKFLDESANIVKRDALYDCWVVDPHDETKRINMVEKFSTYWPDPSRQRERIKRNTDRVLEAIRQQYAPENPFRPANYEAVMLGKEDPKCPPVPIKFVDGDNEEWDDILRNFTVAKQKIKDIKPIPSFAWECVAPKGKPWVPLSFKNGKTREDFQNKFGLTPYFYMDPLLWKRFMYTLMEAHQLITGGTIDEKSKLDKSVVSLDDSGRWSIIAPGKQGRNTAFKVFLSSIKMDSRACPKLPDTEQSLREWCELMKNPEEIAPLLHIILNVYVPPESGQFDKPKYYDQFVYLAYYNGEYKERLVADAPLKLFRDLLIKQYGGEVKEGEGYGDCFQRFRTNIWNAIKDSGVCEKELKEMPGQWIGLLETLYTFGKERKCYDPTKPVGVATKLGIPEIKPITKEQIGKLDIGTLKLLAKSNSLNSIVIPGQRAVRM